MATGFFILKLFKGLKTLPHFNPELSIETTPKMILEFRQNIENADGVLICTPEYIFSFPSGLKMLLNGVFLQLFFPTNR
ncbi:MAG: NAD(P)H-dependent oxidoreductase [Ferruginibacter sp.]